MNAFAFPNCIFAGLRYTSGGMFEWSDLRYLLEAHRTGSMAAAGRRLGVDQTTVARRIRALERSIGTHLLDQTPNGHKLTAAGSKLLQHAEAIENVAIAIEDNVGGGDYAISGVVRIGVTEGFGNCFLAHHLPSLGERLPQVDLSLVSIPRFVSLANREADIAIAQEKPSSGQLVVSKLTDYNLKLYASPGYLAKHQPICSRADLDGHRFIGYVDDLLYSKGLRYLSKVCRSPRVAFNSTSIVAQMNAAISDAGLAILPCFLASGDPRLVVVLPDEVELTLPYWIAARREQLRLARVRAVWDFLKTIVKENQHVMKWQGSHDVKQNVLDRHALGAKRENNPV
jgi:DNA-binding transcriptional LysR family regulator